MGHYCRICGRERPNEQFSGKGHKIHVCKRCRAEPKSERRAIEDQDDIFRFLQQSHISAKNVIRLRQMEKSDNPQVASLAAIVLEVARRKPYKTRRLKFLAQKHPDLLRRLEATGLIFAHTWDWESRGVFVTQSHLEGAKVNVPENGEGTDLSAPEDWEIPF
jgi:ribosome-binding protein aMBF1 (putative translation factor)